MLLVLVLIGIMALLLLVLMLLLSGLFDCSSGEVVSIIAAPGWGTIARASGNADCDCCDCD